ncbi:MAG: DUF1800 family protein, partial [Roseovarius sp.]
MSFDPARAAMRFGCGLSPSIDPPRDVNAMLRALEGPDAAAAQYPIAGFDRVTEAANTVREARRQIQKAKAETDRKAGRALQVSTVKALKAEAATWFRHMLLRRVLGEDGFRERLTFFWADHLTAQNGNGVIGTGYLPYVEEAIRPHVAGRFADMLKAAVQHPLMLLYLDQSRSVGPNSKMAERRGDGTGLNENLAREVMELHTLGVGGPYGQ